MALHGFSSNKPVYDASLSSMWGMKNFEHLADFIAAARRMGFARVELNHQVNPQMLTGIDLKNASIGSIHEPCPAVIPANDLKKQDLLISSPDEERRRQGVLSIVRSLEMAQELGIRAVVVHCGQIQADTSLEGRLKELCEAGRTDSAEYREMKDRFLAMRASLVQACLQAVKKSLFELLAYSARFGITLGIENRFHIFDIPNFDEMRDLLALAGPKEIGFLYDIGHAQVQGRFGITPHQDWLETYADRIIGVHVHDVAGMQDHLAPGRGELDFRKIAGCIPAEAFRTIEVQSSNTPEQIKKGMQILVDAGFVNLIDGGEQK